MKNFFGLLVSGAVAIGFVVLCIYLVKLWANLGAI